MKVLFAAAGILALLLLILFLISCYERKCLAVSFFLVKSSLLPEDFEGERVLFLSDLHNARFGPQNTQLIQKIRDLHPDCILIGGDSTIVKGGRKVNFEPLRELLEGIGNLAPVFHADGNHEKRMRMEEDRYPGAYREYLSLLQKYGVTHLLDSTAVLQKADSAICISSVELSEPAYKTHFRKYPLSNHYIKDRIGEKGELFEILLLHSPLYLQEAAAWGADLTLAGHFHGGTIVIPGIGGVMSPQFQFFYPYMQGFFHFGEKAAVVSRGLGTHSIKLRVFNKPEIVLCTLQGADHES